MKYSTVFSALVGVSIAEFNVLQHLGANSPWFAGPNTFGISNEVPNSCTVDQAVYIVRHGSRYPDPGAYSEWVELYEKLQTQEFTASGSLQFLPNWKPVLDEPAQQVAQLSPGGYDELYHFGVELRTRYLGWYKYGSPFHIWANNYQRTIDSARLFARGYGGPNATTLGTVNPVLSTDPSAVGNSLATSDSCPAYDDNSGAGYVDEWDSIYLPPIAKRLNRMIKGNLTLTTDDISIFPYLCGFESQILRKTSPFCGVFTEKEILQYEYRQDLRYYYGTGPGSYHNTSVMLPVIQGVIDILKSGPETPLVGATNGEETLGKLTVAFTHDNQINQMVSSMGIFDHQRPLPSDSMDPGRIYVSSRNNPMRGTVAFERLQCDGTQYLRVLLNDAVYPIVGCSEGPGKSCPLDKYDKILAGKWKSAGTFEEFCGLSDGSATTSETGGVTFFTNFTMAAISSMQP